MDQQKSKRRFSEICSKCGGTTFQVEHHADLVEYKGLTLKVHHMPVTCCQQCGNTWKTEGQQVDTLQRIKEAYAEKRDAIRKSEGLLSGEDIQFVLNELGLSKAEAAELFGGGPNAFGKYISGEVLQSVAMDRLLRLALGFGEQALNYLRQGSTAPLKLNAAGVYLAPIPPVVHIGRTSESLLPAVGTANTTSLSEFSWTDRQKT